MMTATDRPPELTDAQQRTLASFDHLREQLDKNPTTGEVADDMLMRRQSAHEHLEALVELGLLGKKTHGHRRYFRIKKADEGST